MPKENRKTAAKPSGEGTRSPAATPASGAASVFTKGESVFKRMLRRAVDKEPTSRKKPSGTVIVGEHENEEPMRTRLENAPVAVPEASAHETGASEVTGKTDNRLVAGAHEAPGDVEPVHTIPKDIQNVEHKISTVETIPGQVETAVHVVDHAVTLNAVSLQPLGIFNSVVNGITNIHPNARMALSVLATTSMLILSKTSHDASVADLLTRVSRTYELIVENKSISKVNATKDVLVQIAQVMQECAQFIANYAETKGFWRRLGKNVFSETATRVANYNSKLDYLMQELRDRALLNIPADIHQIWEDIGLDSLPYAPGVGLDQTKKCPDGPRSEILNEIIDWITDADVAMPRIFWLHGLAGKGKSAIAHTIALHAQNRGMLGSCFCFSLVRQHERLHTKLFPTIARDLAHHDLRLRLLLAKVVTSDYALRDTEDIVEQWQKFILEPLSQVEGSLTRNIVVVIDALDESGTMATRKDILAVLATQGADLPANIRILLTSRPLVDIKDALYTKQHIRAWSLDDIDAVSSTRDLSLYISTKLKGFGIFSDDDLGQLAARSGGLFEWARLACDYIHLGIDVNPKERFRKTMSHAHDGSNLDEMYTVFLRDLFQGSTALNRFRSVMRQILWSQEPLSIDAMNAMRRTFSEERDYFPVELILDFMASFFVGITDTSALVRPLHTSFYDFLLDEWRSGEFFIDEGEVHHDLALASLRIMQAGLRFNICGLLTSSVFNSDVVDLAVKVVENISVHLLYSCCFWATHLQHTSLDSELAQLVRELVTGEQILFWLEVLGVSKFIRKACGALISAENWFQGTKEYEDVLIYIKDGIKFVQSFAGIIEKSTPHLYLSALPFSPSGTIFATSLAAKFPNIAEVVVGQHEDWPRNQQILHGHTSWVLSVAFSPDGRFIVSGSNDKTIQLWDAQTGVLMRSLLQGHTDPVLSVSFSPDGRHILSCSDDKTIQCWSAQTGNQVGNPIQGHTGPVTSAVFSPDGRHIVSGSWDMTIQLWDTQTGTQVCSPFQGHTKAVLSVAFSPNGRHIVSGSDDNTVQFWDVQTGAQVGNPIEHTGSVNSVTFSPDGRHIVSGSDKIVQLWDAQTGTQLGTALQGHTDSVQAVAFSPDGKYIVSGSSDMSIRFWNAATGSQVGNPLYGHTNTVKSVSFSPNGRQIVSGSWDGTIQIWDAQTCSETDNSPQAHTTVVMSLAFSSDGRYIISSCWDNTIQLLDEQTTGQASNLIQRHTGPLTSVAFSQDGRCIVSGSWDDTIQLWDTQTGTQVGKPLQGHTNVVGSVGFSPDGRFIVSGSDDKTIRLWDTQTGAQVGNPFKNTTSFVWSVGFSPDGKHIVSGFSDNTIQLLDAQTGAQVPNPIQGHTDAVCSLAFSPDGRYIASGSWDETIQLWDTQTGGQVGNPLQGHTDSVNSVSFSPDGRYIVSGSSDKTIRLWDAKIVAQVGNPLQRHTGSVNSVAFSPDGRCIVSGSDDKTVQLWDAQTGTQLGTPLRGHTNSVLAVAFSPDARYIVSSSSDKTIQLWRVQEYTHPPLTTTPPIPSSSVILHASQESHLVNTSNLNQNYQDFIHLQKEGWIVEPDGQLLLWMPPSYHSQTSLGSFELDLSRMTHGCDWHNCYSPISKVE